MKRTAVYARYSTDRQNETSITDQLRVCRDYAARKGWTVTLEHTDEGISGIALGNRPGVQRLLKALDNREVDVLLVMELWRLSRSEDLPQVIRRLKFRQVLVVGIQDGFESTARHARMQATVAGMMGAEYCEMVSLRTHSALEMRAKNGQSTGGTFYNNAEVVQEIFTRYAAGETLMAIVDDFNRRQIPSPGANREQLSRPRRWFVSTLQRILANERYTGRMIWNRTQWIKDPDTGIRQKRNRPESEWVVRSCERIIDDGIWQRVQARLRARTGQAGRGGVRRWLLSGILECAVCGGKMIMVGSSQHRYGCGAYHAGGEHACMNASSFPRETAERMILAPVIDDLLSPAAITEGIRLMRAERTAPQKAEPPDREVQELERLVRIGVLSADIAAPSLEAAHRKAQERRAIEPAPILPWPSEKAWREAVVDMREILTGADIRAARETLCDLIGPIRCHPAKDGYVLAETAVRNVLLATGTVGGSRAGTRSQPIYRIKIPVSARKRRGSK